MSQLLINQYLNELVTLKKVSGVSRESVVREAFKDLLKAWGKSQDLTFIPEHEFISAAKVRNYVDGALLHDLRVPFGYWEAKDADDDLDAEIAKKFRRGYPDSNIIFEDSTKAVLFQHGIEVMRCAVDGPDLQRLLELFFGYQRPEIADFRRAVVQFKADLPAVLRALRERIDTAYEENERFQVTAAAFLSQAKRTINPSIDEADVREMLIQHILTEEIFAHVFNDSDFHRQNNVAQALYGLENEFFKGNVKRQTLAALEPYYAAIRSTAALISSHSEKQGFLKAIYEDFYKVYNPNAADRLGVVYTPNEIVRFMVESADWLCEKYFNKSLIDRDVNILDPATGTGTFIVELMEHFRGRPEKLVVKYLSELYANEVAILPYYVANLNIEATYASIVGKYEEFPGLCFVDTLDNVAALGMYSGYQPELFGAISDENVERVRRQNSRRISVIIGNPPYNANQQNENDNNKNRAYQNVDRRIKQTYIKQSNAQKTKLYDMYVRFFRWATDRLGSDGMICFVTNSSFLTKNSFDGFRKAVARDFSELWVVNLKGDARTSGEARRAQGGNIFGDKIKVGIAVYFAIKKKGVSGFKIHYDEVADYVKAEEKIAFICKPLAERKMREIRPASDGRWLGESDSDFATFLPLASKTTKASGIKGQDRAIFKAYSLGVSTNRDDWVYGRTKKSVAQKMEWFISEYQEVPRDADEFPPTLKWSRNLKRRLARGQREAFDEKLIVRAAYRPFERRWLYQSGLFVDELGLAATFFPPEGENRAISFSAPSSRTGFISLAVDGVADLHFGAAIDGYQQVARYRYSDKNKIDNITDWAVRQFSDKYKGVGAISKDDIFAYVYAVLHDPIYRERYDVDLRLGLPRIPLYSDFRRWRNWGQTLLNLHIGYDAVAPSVFTRTDTPDPRRAEGSSPAVKLKSDPDNGLVVLDSETQLSDIPPAAWKYRLGNRAAIDWVLEQHKERLPKDPTVRERFNTYRFADHKEAVIDLLGRVVAVSLGTVEIVEAMRALPAGARGHNTKADA